MPDNETTRSWSPAGNRLRLPGNNAHVWARLQELMAVTWPTLTEETERNALVGWLDPAARGSIGDASVLAIAMFLADAPPMGDLEFQLPAYDAAGVAWQNLTALASGKTVAQARPQLTELADRSSWGEHCNAQAKDWWRLVMRRLDTLTRRHTLYSTDLTSDNVAPALWHAMHGQLVKPLFDGPMAIGAAIYAEQPHYGIGGGYATDVMEAFATATIDATAAFNNADRSDEQQVRATALRLLFMWGVLKGFVYQGMRGRLPEFLFGKADLWQHAKTALTDGLSALHHIPLTPGNKQPLRFDGDVHQMSRAIAATGIPDLIAQMDEEIAKIQPLPRR